VKVIAISPEAGMLVSVVIPACNAHATIGRALQSLLTQDHTRWEAVVVSDDGTDYAAFLAGIGLTDPRIRHVSTGRVRSGCHNARNVGLAAASGDIIAHLDADDLFLPGRLRRLAPLAFELGAIADNIVVESETTGALLSHAVPEFDGITRLGLADILALNTPLVPMVRRDHAQPRWPGVELAEDVVANLRMSAALAGLPLTGTPGYVYRIVEGSICHDADSGARFDAAYSDYVRELEAGHGFGLPPALRPAAAQGFAAKRAFNRRFAQAQQAEPGLTFPEFAARCGPPALTRPSPEPAPAHARR
jgi:glycosyltransferase involved in cell wall biosynthesis